MTDLRERTPTATTASGAAAGAPGDADPLHNLYRMSRTAGLGSGDYVAINNTSIVALLLGLASSLALLFPSAIVVGAAAVVCGIIALVQIRSSNGTETGRVFAALGILLGLGLAGAAAGKLVIANVQHRRDEAAIGQVIKQLSDHIVAKRYSEAYQTLFSDNFKGAFNEAEFARRWEAHIPVLGEIQSIGWGGRAEIQDVRATGERRAVVSSSAKFSKFPDSATQPIGLVYHEGEWMIDSIAQLFERAKPGGGPEDEQQQPNPAQPQGPAFSIPGTGNPG
jgi:hypothetical protein